MKSISAHEIKEMMDKGEKPVVLNVLGAEEFEKERICGSINIPLQEIGHRAPGLIRTDDTVVVHCSGPECTASGLAAGKLEQLGYSDVRRFEGGLKEWRRAGYCLEGNLHEKAVA